MRRQPASRLGHTLKFAGESSTAIILYFFLFRKTIENSFEFYKKTSLSPENTMFPSFKAPSMRPAEGCRKVSAQLKNTAGKSQAVFFDLSEQVKQQDNQSQPRAKRQGDEQRGL